ncbi:hypothetical protein [Lacinutrix sp. MedPE-SW]|uniref:hypothetical protein n=1 Tax=Lacinutrix sp. MedPE-SW TaxID=1860087 RepID=UPI000923910F|nr:hypothetical protein [Lacinutrix sp. MedPE-SW]OIQ22969.1 MAG: hypothetical protein BM549_05460 [Lacinutrix sp. MedPE-SW]
MKLQKTFSQKLILITLSLCLLSSCRAALAPEYDKAIVQNLTETTSKTLQFLASVSIGTNAETFSSRENKYNELIGEFEMLKLLARARPLPKNNVTQKINKILASKNGPTNTDDYPSAFAFNRIVQNLNKMKATDKKTGLNTTVVQAFKGEIVIFLDQAVTYESFLKR